METFKNNLYSQLWNTEMSDTVPLLQVTHILEGEAEKKEQ